MKSDYPDGYKGPEENRSSPSEPNTLDVVRGRSIDVKNNNVGKDTSRYQNSDGDKYHSGNNRAVIPLGEFTNYVRIFLAFFDHASTLACTFTVIKIEFLD